jgi:hypothetical protein
MERADYSGRTGANLDDEVATAIKRAALRGNVTLMSVAFARLWQEIRVVQPSGCIDPPRVSDFTSQAIYSSFVVMGRF